MSTYYVLLNLKRDGKSYSNGASVEIEDKKIAERLLADGVLSKDKSKEQTGDDDNDSGNEEDDEKDEGGGKYDKLSTDELKAEITKRELKGGRSNSSRISALEEDDEKDEGGEAGDDI